VRRALTHVRPYISESGAKRRGPVANEIRNMESVMARIVSLAILKWVLMSGRADAIIELASGVANV